MPIMDRLDPEFAALAKLAPPVDLSDIGAARASLRVALEPLEATRGVSRVDRVVPSRNGSPGPTVRVFRPEGAEAPSALMPCLYWIRGGGYVFDLGDIDNPTCERIVLEHRCVVVAVEWRLAPEHQFPAAADDCYAGIAWVMANAVGLGVDASRIVIGGRSSGGGSAAGLALLVRDRREFSVAHQLLIYPMLDDRNSTPSTYMVTDPGVWNRSCNELAWRYYLGDAYGTDDVSPYASPARMEDLSGLPPTTILTGELDLFVDENILYAQRLSQAGVPTELHVYRAVGHGFDLTVPTAAVSRRMIADQDAALRYAFGAVRAGSEKGNVR